MPIEGSEWKDLLDRFATKNDMQQFQQNVERILSVINAKLDQVVVKEMQEMLLKQEDAWKTDTVAWIHRIEADVEDMKRNRLPPWIPTMISLGISITAVLISYFHPHF